MIPGVLFLLVFFYLPVIGNVVAFQDLPPYLGLVHSGWNGLQNLFKLYDNPDFWDALRNTLVRTDVQLLLFYPVPIGVALIVDSLVNHRVRQWVQTIAYLFFFHDTATTEIYTLSLHDALPISARPGRVRQRTRPFFSRRISFHSRHSADHVPRPAVDHAAVRRLRHRVRIQQALPLSALAG